MLTDPGGVARRSIPPGVEVYEVNGPFFFGAADKVLDVLGVVARKPSAFILRLRNVPAIDATGIRVLDDLDAAFRHRGIRFILAGLHAQPFLALDRAGRLDRYGRENLAADLDEALALAAASPAGGEKARV
jgi:SulP family sulfate permease